MEIYAYTETCYLTTEQISQISDKMLLYRICGEKRQSTIEAAATERKFGEWINAARVIVDSRAVCYKFKLRDCQISEYERSCSIQLSVNLLQYLESILSNKSLYLLIDRQRLETFADC